MLTGWKDAGSDHPVATRPDRVQLGLTGAASDPSGAARAGSVHPGATRLDRHWESLSVCVLSARTGAGSDFTGTIKLYWRWKKQTAYYQAKQVLGITTRVL